MWKPVPIDTPGVLGLECAGKMSSEDFEAMQSWLDRHLAGSARPALVVFLGSFEGYEDMSAFWADLKVDTRFVGKFSRIAMVGDQRWLDWSTRAADVVSGADLKWFPEDRRAEAIAWAATATETA